MSDFWYLMQANISSLGSQASSIYWVPVPISLVFFQLWVLKAWDMFPTRDKHAVSRSWGGTTLIWQRACTQAASALNSSSRQRRIYSFGLLQPPHNYTCNSIPLIITSQATSYPLVPHKEVYFVPGVFKWKKFPALVGFQVTSLCRAVRPISGLSVAQRKQEGEDEKRVKARKALILQRGIHVATRSCLCCVGSGSQLGWMGGTVIICCINQNNS